MVIAVLLLPEPTAVRLIIIILAFQGFPAYFTGYLPAGTLFADDAVMLVTTAGWLLRSAELRRRLATFGATAACLFVLAVYLLAVALLTDRASLEAKGFAIWHITYLWPIAFIVANSVRTPQSVERLLEFTWKLAWLQAVVAACQWPIVFALGYRVGTLPVDLFAGTFGKGHAHILGIWMGMLASLAVALWMHGAMPRVRALFAIAAFIFVLISSSSRQVYVILPVALAVVFWFSPMNFWRRLALAGFVPVLLVVFFRVYSVATEMTFSIENLLLKQQQHTRLAFYGYSWEIASKQGTLGFGAGPGSYTSTAGLRYGATLAKVAREDFPHDPNMVSSTQWPVLLVEYGIFGTALFLFVFGALSAYLLKIVRCASTPQSRGLALGGIGAILILLASGLAGRSFEYQIPTLHVWLIAGLAHAAYANEQHVRRNDFASLRRRFSNLVHS
jgi:hypothetical protein